MNRLTEDDPIEYSNRIVDTYNIFDDPFTNYCPDCEGCGYSNVNEVEENDYYGIEVCTRCNGSGELKK